MQVLLRKLRDLEKEIADEDAVNDTPRVPQARPQASTKSNLHQTRGKPTLKPQTLENL